MSRVLKFSDGSPVVGNCTATSTKLDNPNVSLLTLGESKMKDMNNFAEEYRKKPRNSPLAAPINLSGSYTALVGSSGEQYNPQISLGSISSALRMSNINSLLLSYVVSLPFVSRPPADPPSAFTIPLYFQVNIFDFVAGVFTEKALFFRLNSLLEISEFAFYRLTNQTEYGTIEFFDTIPYRVVDSSNLPDFSGTTPNSNPKK